MTRKAVVGTILVGLCAGLIVSAPAFAQERVSATEKGSLLIFPKVEIRWDSAGVVIQDTFIDLTNDFNQDVALQMYFVNGDYCDAVDVGITLTANEPSYWSALTGLPKGVSPFTILEPGNPPGHPDPDGSGDWVLSGYILVWAVNLNGEEIRWNHLKGDALIVNYLNGSAWEYNAYAYQSHLGANGAVLPGPGELLMNGFEYDQNFTQLLLDFYAVGSTALSGGGRIVSVDTDLTLLPLGVDLRQEGGPPITTKANFDIWNMNEWHFSGTERCITCWDQELLSNYDAPNHFLLGNLQTDKGKARIDGLQSQVCDFDYDPTDGICGTHPGDVCSSAAPFVALSMKVLTFGAGADFGMAGSNVVGMGWDPTAVIQADVILSPPPERPLGNGHGKPLPVGTGAGR